MHEWLLDGYKTKFHLKKPALLFWRNFLPTDARNVGFSKNSAYVLNDPKRS